MGCTSPVVSCNRERERIERVLRKSVRTERGWRLGFNTRGYYIPVAVTGRERESERDGRESERDDSVV